MVGFYTAKQNQGSTRVLFRKVIICLSLVLVTGMVYWQTLSYDFVNLDDTLYVTENHHVQNGLSTDGIIWAFTTTQASNWHPLTWLSHMLDYQLYGMNPHGHHLTSVLFHLANAVLLFLLLNRITGTPWSSGFVAALFALHPLHLESVAWVAERKDVLSTFFGMLTLWFYAGYVERPGSTRYLLTLSTFALGLMAKPMLVTLPFVLLLLDYWPLERIRLGQRNNEADATRHTSKVQQSTFLSLLREKVPFLALAALSSIVTFSVQRSTGAMTALDVYPVKTRVANALLSYVAYMGQMLWPQNLAVIYPHPGNNLQIVQAMGAGLLLLCLSVAVVLAARRYPYLPVGWFWYLGTLVPVIGLVQVGVQARADRYTYIPLIGLFIIIAWGVSSLSTRWRHQKAVITGTAGIILLSLAAASYNQLHTWKDSVTLFQHTVQVTAGNFLAHNNLGAALAEQGKNQEAISHYRKALEINPNYWSAHNNLANVLAEQGNAKEAFDHYHTALKIKPDDAGIHNNFATFLAQQGKTEQAIAQYSRALEIRPDFAEVYSNLGSVFKQQGKLDKAIAYYRKALEIKPNQAEAHNNLGIILAHRGRLKEAVNHYSEALRLNPESAEIHNNLAVALVELGEIQAGISHYDEAIKLQPDYAEAHNNLGNALAEWGKFNEAIAAFSTALKIRPHYPEAQNDLGVALARQGRLNEAIYHFKQALRFKPDYLEARTNLELALQMRGRSEERKVTRGNP